MADVISLLPIDVGFDLKLQAQPVVLPREPRLRVKYIDSRGFTRDDEMSYAQTRFVLRRSGYVLSRGKRKSQ